MKTFYFFIISILLIISVSQHKTAMMDDIDTIKENIFTKAGIEPNIIITQEIYVNVVKAKINSVTAPSDNFKVVNDGCNVNASGCFFVLSINGGEPVRYNLTKKDFIDEMEKK